jgi:hypothetical protein
LPEVKLDLRKALKQYYNPPAGEVEFVKVPPMKYIMVDGNGEPGGEGFQQAMGAIYNVAYTMKFRSKKLLKKDYNVMAPEGLWWVKGGKIDPKKPGDWLWTLMAVLPDFVTPKLFSESKAEVRRKKNSPGLDRARLETFDEGLCVQTLHIGPYSAETTTINKMEAFAKEHGYEMVGKHHEIYLGDPRRAAPSKLKTILRHPVAKA